MKLNDITEIDLYTYVFFRDQLEKGKNIFIEANLSAFASKIEYISAAIEESSFDDDAEIEAKTRELFPDGKIFRLSVVKKESKYNSGVAKFAAKSSAGPAENSFSFLDQENGLLLKILHVGDTFQIYLLSDSGDEIKNYDVLSENFSIEIRETMLITQDTYRKLVTMESVSIIPK